MTYHEMGLFLTIIGVIEVGLCLGAFMFFVRLLIALGRKG